MCIDKINNNSKATYTIGWEIEQRVLFRENLAQILHGITDRLEDDTAPDAY